VSVGGISVGAGVSSGDVPVVSVAGPQPATSNSARMTALPSNRAR
jgi:hypothetical protein